jgi:8-amino-7-oxononanoate synthase
MAAPLDWIAHELQGLAEQGLVRRRRVVTRLPDGWCAVDGRRVRNFASNDYLNLAQDPRVMAAAEQALQAAGVGAGSSALVSGHTEWHAALEERLARFEGQPAAVLFPTGYAANVGTIAALVGKDDSVFSDRLNHASLVDGCRLSGARLRIYRHQELEGLERELRKESGPGRRLIVTDSVFSMDGDLAPLPELCDLAERFGAMLLVDEAHGTGVFGSGGRGVCELQGVEHRVTVRVGTLSKAVGSIGGFVAGSRELVNWLWNRARTQIYSTALPAAACAAAAMALDIIESEPERRARLLANSATFRGMLSATSIETVPNSTGPIVPVVLHTPDRALAIAERLEEQGYLVGAIRPPTVPEGTSRLRITLSSAHSRADIATLAEQLGTLHTPPLSKGGQGGSR